MSSTAQDTAYCVKRPGRGVLNGLLEAKKGEKGRIPSRPSSWITVGEILGEQKNEREREGGNPLRPCVNCPARILPNVESAMSALKI